MTSADPARRPARVEGRAAAMTPVRIKICGITRLEDARLAGDLDVDAIGFVLWPGSPRAVSLADAETLCRAVPPWTVRVGVFVAASVEAVGAAVAAVGLGAVQLHGVADPAPYLALARADPVGGVASRQPARSGHARRARRLMLDAHDPKRHGGTGRTIDWTRAAGRCQARAARRARRRADRRERRDGDRDGAALRRRRVVGRRGDAGRQDRPSSCGRSSTPRAAPPSRLTHDGSDPCRHRTALRAPRSRCARLLRRLRRPFRPRDAGGADRGARGGLLRGPRATRRSGPSSTGCCTHYVGRPTPLWEAARLSEACGGARIFLKREDLNHTGAHKINNALGQALLARRMGKRRVIAETGAGQHGVASATAAALLGLECVVYMGDRGHGAPGAQRVPHAPARRRGARRGVGQRARSRTPSTTRCATGSRIAERQRTTCSARRSARIPIRSWCASSRA